MTKRVSEEGFSKFQSSAFKCNETTLGTKNITIMGIPFKLICMAVMHKMS